MNRLKKYGLAMLLAAVGTLTVAGVAPQESGNVVYAAKATKVKAKKVVVKLNTTSKTMNIGNTVQLKLSGNKQKVVWTSSNTKVATVNKLGKVTSVNNGSAIIKATVGKKSYKCTIKVLNPVISDYTIKMNVGDTKQLSFKNNSKTIKWMSSYSKNATVDDKGLVTAKKEGNATIYAEVSGKRYACHVAIKDPNNEKTQIKETAFLGSYELSFNMSSSEIFKKKYGFDMGYHIWDIYENSPLLGKIETNVCITKINDKELIPSTYSLYDALDEIKNGDKVKITYRTRSGNKFIEKSTTITVKTYYYIDGLSPYYEIEDLFGVIMGSVDTDYFPDGLYIYSIEEGGLIDTLKKNNKLVKTNILRGDILSDIKIGDLSIKTLNELNDCLFSTDTEMKSKLGDDPVISFKINRLKDGEYEVVSEVSIKLNKLAEFIKQNLVQ